MEYTIDIVKTYEKTAKVTVKAGDKQSAIELVRKMEVEGKLGNLFQTSAINIQFKAK